MLYHAVRTCEKCGMERKISVVEEMVTTLPGRTVRDEMGDVQCGCVNPRYNAFDRRAIADNNDLQR